MEVTGVVSDIPTEQKQDMYNKRIEITYSIQNSYYLYREKALLIPTQQSVSLDSPQLVLPVCVDRTGAVGF